MQYEQEPRGNFTPEELNKLRRIKEKRIEDTLPRTLFMQFAQQFLDAGLAICRDLKIPDEGPLGIIPENLRDIPDPYFPTSPIIATIRSGITYQEFRDEGWRIYNLKEDGGVPSRRPIYPYGGLDVNPPKVISHLLLDVEKRMPEHWEKAYQVAREFAKRLGFLDEYEDLNRGNPRIKFLKALYHSMSHDDPIHFNKIVYGEEHESVPDIPHVFPYNGFSGLIQIPHVWQPFTLNMRVTDDGIKDDFSGIPEYLDEGIGVDLIEICYTP